MTFWDHLDDLRKALTYPFLTLLVLTVVAFLLKDQVFGIMLAANDPDFITYGLAPGGEGDSAGGSYLNLVSTELPAQMLMHMKVSFYVGVVLTIPFFFYKLFRFASPAMYKNERTFSVKIIVSAFVAFFAGVQVNYFIIFPFSLRFLAGYQVSAQVENMITLNSYMGTLISLSLLMGLCFELPVMSWLLSKLGVLKATLLKKYRRHAIVAIVAVSAVITPTTDIFTLLLVSAPVTLLYELSILIVRVSERKSKSVALALES